LFSGYHRLDIVHYGDYTCCCCANIIYAEKKGEEIYHESVTQCSWARSIYIDATEEAPQLVTQIQDLICEKELRLLSSHRGHVES